MGALAYPNKSSWLISIQCLQSCPSLSLPSDYTQSYHHLMRHLAKEYDQKSILKVVKSLAAFRPSLIALQMPLTFEDEVFLEKSFQRTLIVSVFLCDMGAAAAARNRLTLGKCFVQELEKLISYSGTPTIVWRRTGEICVVGEEFSKLTGWNQSDLLGMSGSKGKFIYELFDRET